MIHTEPNWKSYMVETTEPIFTPEQCEIISKLGRAMPPQNAQVGGGKGGEYNTKTRISHISWIPFNQPDSIPMYKKLNYLASTLAPDYTAAGFMRGNIVRLTLGGYLYEQPGFISSLTYKEDFLITGICLL